MAEQHVEIFIKIKDLASRRIKEINKIVGRSATAFRSFGVKASRALSKIRKKINAIGMMLKRIPVWAKVASAAFAFYLGKQAVSAIIMVGAKYEQLYNRILVASRGLRDETDKTWAKVLDFAAKSPLMTEPVVAAFATLKAAGVESAFEVTKTLSGLALMFNRQVDDLAGMFLGALQRVFRRMGIIIDRSGKKAIIQTAAWTAVVSKDIRSVWKGLAEVIDKSFGDALEIMRNTWMGTVKEMKGKWDVFLNSIARAGILDFLIATLKTANAWFDRLADAGKLDDVAKKISEMMISMTKGFIAVVAQVGKLYEGMLRIKIVSETIDPGKAWTRIKVIKYEKELAKVQARMEKLRKETEGTDFFGRALSRAKPTGLWDKSVLGLQRFLGMATKSMKEFGQDAEIAGGNLQFLVGKEIELTDQIKAGNEYVKARGKLSVELGRVETENLGIVGNMKVFFAEVEKTLRTILGLRKQTAWEQERIRNNLAIQKRFEYLSNQANEKLNNLLREQKQIRDSLLGATDEDIAKMEWVMSKLKEIKEKPGEFMTSEIIGLLQGLGKVVGEDITKPILEAMAKLRGARLLEMEVAWRGLPTGMPGPPRIEREITTARAEQALALARAREEVLKTVEMNLTVNPRFINQIKVELKPGVEALSKELNEIFEVNIDRMMELWRERHTQDRMDLRARSVESDAIVGVP